jgi:tripartite ATP-independent transporter DctP family solute receptor
MTKPRVLFTLAAALVLSCGPSSGPTLAQQTTVLKLGNVQAPGMPVQTGLKRLADLVKERTNGEVVIEIYPAAQLGSEQEILEGVSLGTIHMFEGSAASVGRFLPRMEAFACPFAWKSPASLAKAARSGVADELAQELVKKRGIRLLDAGWIFGIRHLTTTKTEVKTPSDMKGLKIRVQPDALYLATVRAMGGNPTPIDAKEVYMSLQAGVVDGQENPISNIYNRKFNEVQKYLMLTGHITQNQVVVISEKAYQQLTPKQQAILRQATLEAGDYQNGLIAKADQEGLAKLKSAGMQVIEPDVTAFRKAAAGVCRDATFEKKWGKGFYDRLEAAQN